MNIPLQPPQPGDPITADFAATLVAIAKNHEARLAALEGTGSSAGKAVVITGLVPAGPVRIGDQLQILGQNFDFSIGAQAVYFDSAAVTSYATGANGSSDTRLVVQVPPVANVVESGTDVTLTVANLTTTATRTVTLKPALQAQQGNVYLSYTGVSPTTPAAGAAFNLSYSIRSGALLPAQVTINPTVSVPGWQGLLRVLDIQSSQIPNGMLSLNPGETKQFSVQILQIPSGTAAGTPFSISVTVSSSGMSGSFDGPRSFSVGTASQQPDSSISLSVNVGDPPSAYNAAANEISLAIGSTATVQLKADFTISGVYDITVTPTNPNWKAVLSQSILYATSTPITITAVPATQFPAFDITAEAGASPTAQVTIKIQRQGQTSAQTKTFGLKRI
jgi:hypothetical protein